MILQTKLGKGVLTMTKEEILAKAREENAGVDEVKQKVERDASKLSQAVGLAACMLFNFVDALVWKTDVIGSVCWILYGIMVSTDLWVYAAGLKKAGYWIGAVVTTVFTVMLTVFLAMGL